MQFFYSEPQTDIERFVGGFHYLNAIGKIKSGDADHLRDLIQKAAIPPRTRVYIDSTGGDVEEAIEIGRIIRGGWLSTDVGKYILTSDPSEPIVKPRKLTPGSCLSAATLIYLGGRLRFLAGTSRFGVHRFSYENPSPENTEKSQVLSAKIARYLADMEINPTFLEKSASVSSKEISYLDKSYLKEVGVVTEGVTKPVWTMQAKGGMLYARGERDCIFGHHKVMLGYNRARGFCFWSVIEAQGREQELTEHPCVEITLNGEDERIDISNRCERGIYGIYVNILAFISRDEAKKIACSDSFGIQVRGSKTSEVFLGISSIETAEGREMLTTLFENAT
jgi:hypothetical protein